MDAPGRVSHDLSLQDVEYLLDPRSEAGLHLYPHAGERSRPGRSLHIHGTICRIVLI